MKKKQHNSVRASALQITLALGLISLSAILFASSLTSSPGGANASSTTAIQPDTPMPDVVQLIGPVILNTDLRDLPYIAPSHEFEEKRLTRYPHPEIPTPTKPTSAYQRFESLMKQILSPMPQMPGPLLGAGPYCQCIGVPQTGDPVSGGWFLYAVQHDPANPTWIGDYPKFAFWRDAYYLTVNLFDGVTLGFQGVRAFALDRASMLVGGPANTIAFNITPAGLGDSYSLVPAGFRTGNPPSVGRDEFLLSLDSPATGGVTLTQVHGWKFHVDFGTPANSTLGIGVNHSPNATIAVAGFVDAFTTTTLLVPQIGTTANLDTLG